MEYAFRSIRADFALEVKFLVYTKGSHRFLRLRQCVHVSHTKKSPEYSYHCLPGVHLILNLVLQTDGV